MSVLLRHWSITTFVISVAALAVAFSASAAASRPSDWITSRLGFEQSVDVASLLKVIDSSNVEHLILESSFVADNEPIVDFLSISSSEINDVQKEYIAQRKAFLQDVGLTSGAGLEDIRVSGITITARADVVERIRNSNMVSTFDSMPDSDRTRDERTNRENPAREVTLQDSDPENPLGIASHVVSKLVPNAGTSYFGASSDGGVFTQQYMKWDTPTFASDQTYEHDVFLNNYDGKTYLDGRSTGWPECFPMTTYAATSWPSASKPYLDTRFTPTGCEKNELAFTIGMAQASALASNTSYYTYLKTATGNATSDSFKLQAQPGHRSPTNCYTTWCSYADMTVNLIAAWAPVPGSQSWVYQDVPSAPSNVSITNPTTNSLRVNFKDNATNETSILIERKKGTSGSWASLGGFGAMSGAQNWYWVNSGLSSRTTYCYRLRAVNSAGYSEYSNQACGTTK